MLKLAIDIFTIVGGIIGLSAFVKGVIELIHSNAIRRYEKFHQMSVRFDENPDIQKVCASLHGDSDATEALTKQQKEVFICFLEEIYFMMNSGIMKRELALYTFGYYGKMAMENEQFWQGLDRSESFYTHFIHFCTKAKSFKPSPGGRKRDLSY